eukprot:gb/GECG01002788.1/.p1 GENE.gb/GECG01002788.1/~~gb/GECG01002788.1/.p1  ORF type:complete len:667 (+),score=91.19 gb/GECG01002788.1/:1-2001(+)
MASLEPVKDEYDEEENPSDTSHSQAPLQQTNMSAIEQKRARFMQGTDTLPGSTEDKKIFTAYDREQGVEVAMHVVSASGPGRPRDNLYDFQHEHLMKVIDSWQEDNTVIYITEILTAGTLEGYIKRIKEDVRVKVVRKWCNQILDALEYLHTTQGQAHGDLRLDNIFINGESGNIRLGTFRMVSRSTRSGNPTEAGRFTPPEGDDNPTTAGDIYSFGLCVLQMVTRVKPYWLEENETFQAMQEAKLNGEMPITLLEFERKPEGRPEIAEFIRPCLAANPQDRPTVRQLREHPWLTEKKKKKEKPKRKDKEAEGSGSASQTDGEQKATQSASASAETHVASTTLTSSAMTSKVSSQSADTSTEAKGPVSPSKDQQSVESSTPLSGTFNRGQPPPESFVSNSDVKSDQRAQHDASTGPSSPSKDDSKKPATPPRLVAVTFEHFAFRRAKVTLQMSIFYPSSKSDQLAYRSIRFGIGLDDPNESPRRLSQELADFGLIHPDDLETVESWLNLSLGKILDAPYAYTRDMLPDHYHIQEYKTLYSPSQLAGSGTTSKVKKSSTATRTKASSAAPSRHRLSQNSVRVYGSQSYRTQTSASRTGRAPTGQSGIQQQEGRSPRHNNGQAEEGYAPPPPPSLQQQRPQSVAVPEHAAHNTQYSDMSPTETSGNQG